MNELSKTLEARKSVYGDYASGVEFRAHLMSCIKIHHRLVQGREMDETDALCIFDVVNKICRLAVTPSHIDSWHDIAGYATIIENYYKEKEDANK